MNIAVTGAAGFVGRYLVAELERRSMSATLVVRPGAPPPRLAEGSRIVEMDIHQPPADCFERLGRPDVLFHLAWGGLPRYQSPHHRESELPAHRAFLQSLLDSGLGNLVVTGTCLEYGMPCGRVDESVAARPITSYATAKDALRNELERLRAARTFNLTWGRLFYLHGEGQREDSLLPSIRKAALSGETVFNMSWGEQLRDYIHVSRAAEILVDLGLLGRNHGIVNVCSGDPISVRRIAEECIAENNWSIKLMLGRLPYASDEPLAFWGSTEKLQACLRSL